MQRADVEIGRGFPVARGSGDAPRHANPLRS
jgi:hypothetical protein